MVAMWTLFERAVRRGLDGRVKVKTVLVQVIDFANVP